MSNIQAKNIGVIINNPTTPINISNDFDGVRPQTLPSIIPPAKGFIGREVELDALHEAKRNGRTSFVLHGQGGVGKTELALQFIRDIKSEFQAHVRVDMRGLDKNALSLKDAMWEIVREFEPKVSADISTQEVQKLYVQFLNQYKTLIFLDNAKDREQVEPLNISTALVVITSRTRLNVSGGFSLAVEQMLFEDAKALLYSIADEARFAGQARALAHLAGYLPMALLPLASILTEDVTLKAADLLQKYSDRKERLRLADPNRGNLSIEASFDLSYENLSDELKECWRKLAVFPADFGLEALQEVLQRQDAKEIRATLVKSHLLIFNPQNERLRLHDLARDYAQGQLSREELHKTKTFHAGYYGITLAGLDKVTLENLATFDLERANIEAGFQWVQNKIQYNKGFATLFTLYVGYASDILFWRLPVEDIFKWQKLGLGAYAKLGNRKGRSYCLANLGRVYRLKGQYAKAIRFYKKSIGIARRMGELLFEGEWLGNLANVYLDAGNHDEAIKCIEGSIEIAERQGNKRSEGRCLGILANLYSDLEKYEQAIFYYEKALSTFDENDTYFKGVYSGNLAIVYLRTGETQKAKGLMVEALPALEAIKSPNVEVFHRILAELETADS